MVGSCVQLPRYVFGDRRRLLANVGHGDDLPIQPFGERPQSPQMFPPKDSRMRVDVEADAEMVGTSGPRVEQAAEQRIPRPAYRTERAGAVEHIIEAVGRAPRPAAAADFDVDRSL